MTLGTKVSSVIIADPYCIQVAAVQQSTRLSGESKADLNNHMTSLEEQLRKQRVDVASVDDLVGIVVTEDFPYYYRTNALQELLLILFHTYLHFIIHRRPFSQPLLLLPVHLFSEAAELS